MKSICLLFYLALSSVTYATPPSLTLIGGGNRVQSALEFFVKNVLSGPIYVFPWGTSYPQESFQSIKAELENLGASEITCFCDEEFTAQDRLNLSKAKGLYFPGGNQNKVMEKILKHDLKNLITDLYHSGIPVVGTSAGTAIQTNPMLTGNASETSEGLGLLKGFIIDQHFLVRGRQQRLLSALRNNPGLNGIGVDESMSAVFKNNTITALGPTLVTLYLQTSKEIQTIELSDGQSYVIKP